MQDGSDGAREGFHRLRGLRVREWLVRADGPEEAKDVVLAYDDTHDRDGLLCEPVPVEGPTEVVINASSVAATLAPAGSWATTKGARGLSPAYGLRPPARS